MEANLSKDDSPELSKEKTKELLIEVASLITEIYSEHLGDEEYQIEVQATTPELDTLRKHGYLRIYDLKIGFRLDHTAETTGLIDDSTLERFFLTQTDNGNEYELITTGVVPDVMPTIIDTYTNHEFTDLAYYASEDYYEQQMRPATPSDILKFIGIVEVARFKKVRFDADILEEEFRTYMDNLKK